MTTAAAKRYDGTGYGFERTPGIFNILLGSVRDGKGLRTAVAEHCPRFEAALTAIQEATRKWNEVSTAYSRSALPEGTDLDKTAREAEQRVRDLDGMQGEINLLQLHLRQALELFQAPNRIPMFAGGLDPDKHTEKTEEVKGMVDRVQAIAKRCLVASENAKLAQGWLTHYALGGTTVSASLGFRVRPAEPAPAPDSAAAAAAGGKA